MSDSPLKKTTERREYYRINDVVFLRYEILTDVPGAPDGAPEETGSVEISAGSLLAEIDRELNKTINNIWREQPSMAQALGLLNRKISILAEQALDYEETESRSYDSAMVSLSGSGIAFEAREKIADGARLRLSMILRPSQVTMTILGTVISCEERLSSASMPFWVRVDFDDDPMAQEQLIQHVVQKQGAMLYSDKDKDKDENSA